MGRECSILFLLLLIRVSSECENNDFTCRGGKCLSRVKVCDGSFDCEDGDDEENCREGFKCSSPTWFQCNNGQCISSLMFCDGDYDCKDHSDEPVACSADDHLARSYVQTTCSTNEFTCLNKDCIVQTWVCDGTPDCLDGSDETVGCGPQFPCQGGFRCKNNHCIFKEFHCDGNNDCSDGSDEVNCTIKFHSVEHCTEDLGRFLCKDGIVCLDMDHVCDGYAHCFDKSDEYDCMAGPQSNSTYCKAFGCSHDCHLAPDKKTFCTCPRNYKLDASLKQCIDINECEEYGHCYQKCQNLIGGFKCSCDDGYVLMKDNRTCKAKGGEPLLLFASFNQIRGIYLKSGVYFSISTQPNRVIGISHNGKYIYWTEIYKAEASIMRSEEDGSNRIVIANSGLGLPEDLVVDYVTGNIYFTDVEKKHIGVCTDNGICTVLHNENIDKPRAIALYSQKGIMFWTDWGKIPKIATSGMDGSRPTAVLDKNLEWPNGLTLDTSNERLYWVDAKILTIETVRLDGSDRRIVLNEAVKHPFSVAVFEDMLYWSDWENIQIEKCNKFTGKNHTAVIREKIHKDDKNKHTVYGVHIYHPALHPRVDNPCQAHVCSDLCLLSPNNTYKCACREDFGLGPDLHTCRRRRKSLQVVVAGRTHLSFISPRLLGKQFESRRNLDDAVGLIECMAYDSISGHIIISDTMKKKIFRLNMRTSKLTVLISSEIGKITSMSFDSYGNNLYMGDEERMRVEVLSMTTKYSIPIYKVHNGDILQSVVVVPEHGVFFVAVATASDSIAISRVNMDGTQIMPHITGSKIIGPKVMLTYDKSTQKILWFDSGAEIIESMNIDGSHRKMVQITEGTPLSLAVQDKALMWINYKSTNLYFYDTTEEKMSFNDKNIIKLNEEGDPPRSLIIITEFESQNLHPCQNQSKHGCSHLCLVTINKHGVCACPLGMHLTFDNRTCVNPAHCTENQFKCRSDDICISRIHRCDGHKDCPSNDDEKDCEINNCKENQFKCANGQCIALHERCDHEFDCSDQSDEINCPFHCKSSGESFQCGSGECIPRLWTCDFAKDCKDGSDENNCGEKSCPSNMFRCKNGMCISASWECDSDIDCADASDEDEHCVASCSPTEFHCGTGRCVSLNFMCDGGNDCGDNSDELNCKVNDKEPKCSFNELLCSKANPICVPQKSRCNGTAECPRGEDEMDCANCLSTEFQCKNFKCIFNKWLCDKTNDCEDNSDEDPVLCAHEFGSVGKVQPCQDFSCKSGECLPLYLVCNGQKDCEDGSDEGGNCENVCKNNPCDHVCLPTPVSARCSCHPGYSLSSNGQKCNDIDECAEEKCSQICQNTLGGFNCSCLDGYLLKSDRMTCKAEGDRMSFVLSGDDEIRKVSYNFNEMDLLVFDAGAQILGLDVDTRKNQIYWSSGSSNKISLLDMGSGQKTYIETTDRPGKLSYDWLTGNVYYIDNSSPNSIKVCNLVTRKRATLLTVGSGILISNLAVEPISGAIFYSQVRSSAFQRPVSEIFKYTFIDQNSTVLVTSDVSWVSGLVVDPVRRFVYWSDLYYQVIEKVKFDGNQRQIVFQSQVRRPESLVLFEDSLVWLTRGSGEIKKCILHGEHKGFCDTIALYIYDIKFVTIMQEVRQPNSTNPCLAKCDIYSICVSTSNGPKCLCEDGTVLLPNTSCQFTNTKLFSRGRSLEENAKSFLVSQEPPSSSSTSTLVAIFVTLLIVCGLIATYILVKRRKSNVVLETMHFQNPSFGLSHIENNYQNDMDHCNRVDNPATRIIQQTDGKLGMLFRGKKADSKEKPGKVDYDSDSDNYERTDMKANLIR